MTRFKAWLNDAVMPFTVENIRSFFPKTVISYDANGRIWASDAPDKDLPSTLPGLSSRQFPEISYLPIEFDPKQPKSWGFTRQISGSPMQFQLREDGKVPSMYAVTSVQTLESLEDGSSRATRKKEDAAYRLTSTIKGDGTIWFNRSKHCVERMSLVVQTETLVKGIVNDFASTRKLTTSLELKLKTPAPSLASLLTSGPH
jgi:hypothetical protein